MIALSPEGSLAALISHGRLLIISKEGHHEVPAGDDSVVVAFAEEVWLVEPSQGLAHAKRLSKTGEVLGEYRIGDVGKGIYARRIRRRGPSAVVGGRDATFVARLDGDDIMVAPVRNPPRVVAPARELVMIQNGQARVSQTKNGRLLSGSDLRVTDGYALLDGNSIALVGRDRKGSRIDVVGVKRGDFTARLRTEPNVLVCTSEQEGRLVIVHDRMLTVFDVQARREMVKKQLTTRPASIAVDERGELLAIETSSGEVDLIELPALTIESGRPLDDEPPIDDDASTDDAASDDDGERDPEAEEAARAAQEVAAWNQALRDSRTPVTPTGSLIGDGFRPTTDPTGHIETRCPFDPDDVVGSFPFSPADVNEAVDAARSALHDWRTSIVEARGAAMRSFDDQLRRRRQLLELTLARETGRPRWECMREVRGLSHRLGYTVASGLASLPPHIDPIIPGAIHNRPYGVTAIIGPAMFPLATSHQHIAAALISGNTVVWKPSPHCIASAQVYADAVRASDLPPGVLNVVFGDDEVGAALTGHRDVDCVVFTGTTINGQRVHQQNAGNVRKRLILHLGSKNAAFVSGNAILDLAAYEIATSAFITSGQRCTALRRAFVDRSVLDEFLDHLRKVCDHFRVGPPSEPCFFGPMLTEARRDRFREAIAAAPRQGAERLHHWNAPDTDGYYEGPTVHLVEGFDPASPYQADEHFGPDLAVYPVSGLAEGVAGCNASDYGLCAVAFTERHEEWLEFRRDVESGYISLNLGTHSVSGRLPLQGVKCSGYGGSAGAAAMVSLRRELAIQQRYSDLVDVWPGTQVPESSNHS